jgi:hypothetical protein
MLILSKKKYNNFEKEFLLSSNLNSLDKENEININNKSSSFEIKLIIIIGKDIIMKKKKKF